MKRDLLSMMWGQAILELPLLKALVVLPITPLKAVTTNFSSSCLSYLSLQQNIKDKTIHLFLLESYSPI
jgi:hypothetical protein